MRKISVIIPCYNGYNFLLNSINSIINQTYKNFEIIIINDGSSDYDEKTYKDIEKIDDRIKVIFQENSGVSIARNKGMLNSTGEYIYFMDSDDLIDNSMFEKMIKQFDSETDCVICGYSMIFNDHTDTYIPSLDLLKNEDIVNSIFFLDYFSAVWNKMFKRQSICLNDKYIEFDSSIYIGEDFLWLFKVFSTFNKIQCIREPLYNWHRRENSTIGLDNFSRIDHKAMSEMDALMEIVNLCKNESTIYLASRRYFWESVSKIKKADRENDVDVSYRLANDLSFIIKKYKTKNIKDFIKKNLWIFILFMKKRKFPRLIIILFENIF